MNKIIECSVKVSKQKNIRDFTIMKFYILLVLVIILLMVTAFAYKLVPYDPFEQDLSKTLQPPSVS
ncbi:hypothetical protein M2651_03575 [Clostridium sp. SYSU_GA19001]|uniref:hypothetical protein n=1 Tax=Clostridium caldaquaticum TaxID=2940653 RepID=UPI002076E2E0|nr:hypothetical protein [Clostridium caldaquaticum]MCM8710108.1 hypothetical protein [Clostridium caldaquaticum]